jgi:hypothetical protein
MLSGGEGLIIPTEVDTEKQKKLLDILSKGWNTFNKYLVCILIASAIGISIGVKVAQKFYSEKMDDATLAGSFVFKGKPFNIIPK